VSVETQEYSSHVIEGEKKRNAAHVVRCLKKKGRGVDGWRLHEVATAVYLTHGKRKCYFSFETREGATLPAGKVRYIPDERGTHIFSNRGAMI